MVKAIIFDRDGVLTNLVDHEGKKTAPWSLEELSFTETAKKAVDLAKDLGYKTFILSNQPDIKDGKLTHDEFWKMHEKVQNELKVTRTFYATTRGDTCYKPNNGALEKFIEEFDIDRNKCFFIGDSWKDVECGKSSNIRTIFITNEQKKEIKSDYYALNALSAIKLVERLENMEKQID